MATPRDYGAGGRLALATPQGNPTVEPELRRLFPADVEYYTLRLTSSSGDARQRMHDYIDGLPEFIDRFAGMPLDGLLFACTASSYLTPPDTLARRVDTTEQRLDAPVFMAADAIRGWLEHHGHTRIALLSPYPDWLNTAAVAWWQRNGCEVAGVVPVPIGSDDTYAIYEQQSADARPHLARWLDIDADAWIVSGTGLPSLPLIAELARDGRPVISSNLALARAGLSALGHDIAAPNNRNTNEQG